MCFEPGSLPPVPSGVPAETRRIELTAGDGAPFATRLAVSATPSSAGIVVLPDIRGLHAYYERLAEALAGAGRHAVALDFYGRTAGAGYRKDDFAYAPHRAQVRDQNLRMDVAAAAGLLRSSGAERVFVWGFCFGGRGAFMQASQPGIAGVIGCYGWPVRREEGGKSPVDEANEGLVRAPVLALYGGADGKITSDDRTAYADALAAAGAVAETVTYDGAPHSFFDKLRPEFTEASDDVWRRVLAFTR